MLKKLLLLSIIISVASCSKQPEVKLKGERISVKPEHTLLQPDLSIKDTKVILPRQINIQDWTQTGGFADHSPLHPKLAKTVNKKWKSSVGPVLKDYQEFIATPIVYDNVIYSLNSKHEIFALDAVSGKKLWKIALGSELESDDIISPGGLAVDGINLIATLGSGDVYAVNIVRKNISWHQQIFEPVRSAPIVKDGKIFVNSLNNKLSVFETDTGNLIWTHTGLNESLTILGDSSPAVSEGVVIVTYSSGEVYALDVNNGGEIWSDTLSSTTNNLSLDTNILDVVASPVIIGKLVHIVNYNGKLSTFNLKTGQKYWTRFVGSITTPWAAGNSIFIIADDGLLASIYRKTGQVKWVINLNDTMHASLSEKDKKQSVFTAPLLAGNRLIIASNKGYAASFNPRSGQLDRIVDLKESISISPIVANSTLYFLTDRSNIIAYK